MSFSFLKLKLTLFRFYWITINNINKKKYLDPYKGRYQINILWHRHTIQFEIQILILSVSLARVFTVLFAVELLVINERGVLCWLVEATLLKVEIGFGMIDGCGDDAMPWNIKFRAKSPPLLVGSLWLLLLLLLFTLFSLLLLLLLLLGQLLLAWLLMESLWDEDFGGL